MSANGGRIASYAKSRHHLRPTRYQTTDSRQTDSFQRRRTVLCLPDPKHKVEDSSLPGLAFPPLQTLLRDDHLEGMMVGWPHAATLFGE